MAGAAGAVLTAGALLGATAPAAGARATPAAPVFYPYFSAFHAGAGHGCFLGYGADLPGNNTNFGRNAQYGSPLGSTYLRFGGGGASRTLFTSFRQRTLASTCNNAGEHSGG